MVATVSSSKKCPPNIRTGPVHPPVLVSPISVAHGNKMMGADASKKGSNWMRDQWVANLKKKRMATGNSADGTGSSSGAGSSGSSTPSATIQVGPTTVKAGIQAESGRPHATEKRSRQRNSSNSRASAAAAATNQPPAVDKDSLSLMHPAMFFNDLGCFELESPSFTRLTPTRDGLGHHLSMASPASSASSSVASHKHADGASTGGTSSSGKKWVKPLMKKRLNNFAAETSEVKRRTPRRPHAPSSTASFDDVDSLSSSSHSYSSVGTPSNFSAEVSRMWGPELDFTSGYVDTFLDLPTPKSAEMPSVSGGVYSSSYPGAGNSGACMKQQQQQQQQLDRELEQPKLIRTTSIEQEGLSHFFEQTSLGSDAMQQHHQQQQQYQQQQHHHHHHPHHTPSMSRPMGKGGKHTATPAYSHHQLGSAAAGAVDECFGKMMPSPAHGISHGQAHHHNSHSHHAQHPHHMAAMAGGRLQPTPRSGSMQHRGDYASSFDPHKSAPHGQAAEFDALVREYEFTDFDQELDSFYLDTIESFGGDLDLISN